MKDGLSFLMWFLLFAGAGKQKDRTTWQGQMARRGPRARRMPSSRPTATPQPVALPAPSVSPAAAAQPAPWPQSVPAGLPPFPGAQWEPDEPPPKDVQARAGQLLQALWAHGAGTFKIERTGARWIAYRATAMGPKKGVVAYRQKYPGAGAPKTEPKGPGETVTLAEGKRYMLVFRAPEMSSSAAEALRATLAQRYPEVNVLSANVGKKTGATVIELDLVVLKTQQVRIGATATVLGHPVVLASVLAHRIKPTVAPPAPTPPPAVISPPTVPPRKPVPPIVMTSTSHETPTGTITAKSPIELPLLVYGMGLKPKAPDENVRLLQSKLGIEADGRFGKGTRAAVVAFQGKHGLLRDGKVGKNTWTALFGRAA
jgi:hypothetical protein